MKDATGVLEMSFSRILPVLVFLLAHAASSRAAVAGFDSGGPDAAGLLRAARQAAPELPRPSASGVGPKFNRATLDCARVAFEPGGPAVSERVELTSTEYVQDCRYVPGYPGRGGGWWDCWERPGFTYRKTAQAEILQRQPVLPWERESFDLCLQGSWLSIEPVSPAYKYKVKEPREGYFTLTPGRRLQTDPDPSGIAAAARPVNTGTGLALEFTDRWASHYGGAEERTVLHVALHKRVEGWFDPVVAEGDATFVPAAAYRVDFAQFGPELERGEKYYVKWSFSRVGALSKPTSMDGGKTARARFEPSSAAAP